MKIIKVKNKTNWLNTIVLGFGLILASIIIFVLLPLISVQETYLLSAITYIIKVIPFLAFYIVFLYLWLWNTFGKTILKFDAEKIIIIKKYKLFSKPKTYFRTEIEKISVDDFKIEKTKYFTRNNIFTNYTFSIVFTVNKLPIRIVDWLSHEKADEILNDIKS
jgi:hypothetical protein